MVQMDSRRMCPHCRAFITNKDRTCPYCNESVGTRAIDRRNPAALLGGIIPHARFTTVVILVINFGLFLATALYSMGAGNGGDFWGIDVVTLVKFGAKYNVLARGEWWRLVTAGFLHGGLLHILMNSWVLFDLGPQVEEIYGTSRMLVIYFVSNVVGFYLSAVWSPAIPSVGASAALMGLIGAMIALGVRHQNPLGSSIRQTYIRWAIYIILFGLLPGLHVDNAAHIGGLAAGFGTAYLAGLPRLEGSWTEKLWRGASWVCILLTAVSFLKMYLWFARVAQ
jgi:rhomboid protease GluP